MAVTRFGVSLEEDLLEALDGFVHENKFPNRSQAIRYLIEKNLVEQKWKCNNIVTGAIVLIFNYDKSDSIQRLSEIQRQYFEVVLSSQRFHLKRNLCLEIVAVKGQSYKLTELSDLLIGIKGVEHGKLLMSKAE